MTNTIDGFNFELPLAESQIIALAQFHRKQLDEAIYHQEIHLGDFCLAQRKRVYDYTRLLEPMQKKAFYQAYDGELKRLADDDDLHPMYAESGLSVFAVFLALAIIAIILYFAVIRALVS
ncbi:hypothetical protein [Acinetobacter sp. ANC 4648]|uniref:hypothetical protein n=1 Tax=Acinetobacter sp. ANC 4648 TaxID=1977875 RepID=UPI000A343E75|nr:hypothetical protein [Acinetobacter sp. ANC 4648]OTG82932.1 hypothetical protein B9T27_06585 [Acinetobacter sp. ANC 4648]